MIKSVHNYPMSQLFDIEASVVYAVPRYQREYTWGKSQWESLFDDMLENEPGYFLGSIICINQSNDVLSVQRLEVVDGQQRLTTLSLLFAAIYHVLKSNEGGMDDEQRFELINLKRKLVLRRGDDQIRVIPQVQNNNLRLFMTIIDKLSEVSDDAIVTRIRNQLISVSASDETFRHKLERQIYEENSAVTRFVLCALAEQHMTRETWIDLWCFENKRFVWTIEHIFPQGEPIPQHWVAMIGNGDENKAKDYQQTHVHKLGNLTISGFNSALGNKSFEEKRDRTDREGRPIGYKNGLKLNEDLATTETWSVAQIDTRTTKLVDQAMVLFKLNEGNT